ncbi:MAG TPA: MCP four helix bundle domain-containing protein, partial [Acidimicrobiales bacterium]|nr:MCP four helix bundle domain-containing protein [Acidimicrobiales bacterium]
MSSTKQRPLKTRMMMGFAAVIALMAMLAVYLITQLSTVSGLTASLAETEVAQIASANEVQANMLNGSRFVRAHILRTEDADMSEAKTQVDAAVANVDEIMADLQVELVDSPIRLGHVNTFIPLWDQVEADWNSVLELSLAGDKQEANDFLRDAGATFNQAEAAADALAVASDEFLGEGVANAQSTYESARTMSIVLLVLIAAAGMAIAFWLAKKVSGQVGDSAETLRASSDELSAASVQVSAAAAEAAAQANAVSAATEQVSA